MKLKDAILIKLIFQKILQIKTIKKILKKNMK